MSGDGPWMLTEYRRHAMRWHTTWALVSYLRRTLRWLGFDRVLTWVVDRYPHPVSTSPGPTYRHTLEYGVDLTREQRAAVYAAWQARERHAQAPSASTAAEVERTARACEAVGVSADGEWVRSI